MNDRKNGNGGKTPKIKKNKNIVLLKIKRIVLFDLANDYSLVFSSVPSLFVTYTLHWN